MKLSRLVVQNYRNISYLDIEPSSTFNIIYGSNGSGKTSLLESISYLGLGRSFRTSKYQSLIKDGTDSFTVSARVIPDNSSFEENIGITRFKKRNSGMQIYINSTHSNRLMDLVDNVCVQVIHPQGIELILGAPELRRNFIDWGVYYSFPEFKELWFNYRKLLSQRNVLLKNKADPSHFSVWDDLLCEISEKITFYRESYLKDLIVILKEKIHVFLPDFDFEFSFQKGWENGLKLRSVLNLNIEKDRLLGYTFYGCHRGDLKIKCNNFNASENLSRGQLKLLVCAMRLSQGYLLKKQIGKNCIYLVDDLSSELDDYSRHVFLENLLECNSQVFLTNISKDIFIPESNNTLYLDIAQSITEGV